MTDGWQVGDRVVWPHREGHGKARHTVLSPGVITALDPKGVHVKFDQEVRGVMNCYATHDELTPESKHD